MGQSGLKSLFNPLLITLLIQIVATGLWWQRHENLQRRLPILLLCSTLLLAILALPVTKSALEVSLRKEVAEKAAFSPAYIFVLGGGYQLGPDPSEDLLFLESQRRVLRGVVVWKSFPTARLVFSGASGGEGRSNGHHAALMRDIAISGGVPEAQIVMETRSINTRMHPIEALRIPGVSASTPIGVVTSAWHMRRAQHEFCRHFQHVALFPVPVAVSPMQWQDFVPDAHALDNNTTLLREWAGLFWYAIAHYFETHLTELPYCAP